jgi:hypothetical protein
MKSKSVIKKKQSVAKKTIPLKSKAISKKKVVVKKKAVTKKQTSVKRLAQPVSSHVISKIKGGEMVKRFSGNIFMVNGISFHHGMQFNKSLFEQLLQLEGVEFIRIYNAVNDDNEHTFVITAVDAKQNDIYFKDVLAATSSKLRSALASIAPLDADGVGNMGTKCPAYNSGVTAL